MGSKRGKVRDEYNNPRPIIMIQSDRSLSAQGLASGMAEFSFSAHASPSAQWKLYAGRALESFIKGGKAGVTIKPHGGFVANFK